MISSFPPHILHSHQHLWFPGPQGSRGASGPRWPPRTLACHSGSHEWGSGTDLGEGYLMELQQRGILGLWGCPSPGGRLGTAGHLNIREEKWAELEIYQTGVVCNHAYLLESVRLLWDTVPLEEGFVSPSLSSSFPPSVWSNETLSRALLSRCISSSPWGDEKLRAAMVERARVFCLLLDSSSSRCLLWLNERENCFGVKAGKQTFSKAVCVWNVLLSPSHYNNVITAHWVLVALPYSLWCQGFQQKGFAPMPGLPNEIKRIFCLEGASSQDLEAETRIPTPAHRNRSQAEILRPQSLSLSRVCVNVFEGFGHCWWSSEWERIAPGCKSFPGSSSLYHWTSPALHLEWRKTQPLSTLAHYFQ